jgi:DNA-binding CsgD family transcriptional regulator
LLAKREAEVARLVADGLSNKEIGARLFISEHTVDSHVRSILNKLGCNSRAQIAAWMVSSNE